MEQQTDSKVEQQTDRLVVRYRLERKRRKQVRRLKLGIFLLFLLLIATLLSAFYFYRTKLSLNLSLNDVIKEKEIQIQTLEKERIKLLELYQESQKETLSKETKQQIVSKNSHKKKEKHKAVYLTFDDGPSALTEKVLDILKEYNAKATFFVIGKEDEYSKQLYRRIVKEGHTLGMHSYSHLYSVIYSSFEEFQKDFTKISQLLYDVTGTRAKFYRFPGGSSNKVSNVDMYKLMKYLEEEGFIYFDWNVSSGDGSSQPLSRNKLQANVLDYVDSYEVPVVLLHDMATKHKTVEALPYIIEALQAKGYVLRGIDEEVPLVQHRKIHTSE